MNNPDGKSLLAAVREKATSFMPSREAAVHIAWKRLPKRENQHCLDAGCGRGGTAALVQFNRSGRVIALDIDAESISFAAAVLGTWGRVQIHSVSFLIDIFRDRSRQPLHQALSFRSSERLAQVGGAAHFQPRRQPPARYHVPFPRQFPQRHLPRIAPAAALVPSSSAGIVSPVIRVSPSSQSRTLPLPRSHFRQSRQRRLFRTSFSASKVVHTS
jgi:hypothetical protein